MNSTGKAMVRYGVILVLVILLGLSSGCTPPEPLSSTSATQSVLPLPKEVNLSPELVTSLKTAVAEALGVSIDSVSIESAEEVEWSNACLDAAKPDEMCAEVITPGYRVVVDTPKGEAVVHSDRTGSSYRLVSP